MKLDTEQIIGRRDLAYPAAADRGWRIALPLIAAGIAVVVALYWETAASMVALWASSETYAHGYLIVPIVLVLVWVKRRDIAPLAPHADYLGLGAVACAGLAWLVAAAAQVQVLQQYALMAMIPGVVLALAGRGVARALAFPLAFLLFAVPFGEAFLPRLMDWTADFTVAALRLSGIPVYREGTFFAIPSGQWSVVEACSGLRYLIASVTVGALYAYLTYRRWWKRALFMAAAVAVPIFANFVRAYIIVMLGHLSSMKLAVGVDHFIYGWVFFGLVIALLFWLGSFWRDGAPVVRAPVAAFQPALSARPLLLALTALTVAALAAPWPLYARYLDSSDAAPIALAAPAGAAGWALDTQASGDWRPHYTGAAASVLAVYRREGRSVVLYLGFYRNQRQGAELVSSQHAVAGAPDSAWASAGTAHRGVPLASGTLRLRETRLRAARGRLLAWDWFRVAGNETSDPYLAKALLAREKLLGRGDDSAAIVLAAPYDARPEHAAETLRLFVLEMLPSINAALEAASRGGTI